MSTDKAHFGILRPKIQKNMGRNLANVKTNPYICNIEKAIFPAWSICSDSKQEYK